jgi:hypothetical protein
MSWDEEKQRQFDQLRARELEGSLSEEEQHALDALLAILDAEEARYLAPALERMDQATQQRAAQLAALQVRNEELAALVRQHEQLLREARSWLATFEQRRLVLQDRYTRLTGAPLPSEPGR